MFVFAKFMKEQSIGAHEVNTCTKPLVVAELKLAQPVVLTLSHQKSFYFQFSSVSDRFTTMIVRSLVFGLINW